MKQNAPQNWFYLFISEECRLIFDTPNTNPTRVCVAVWFIATLTSGVAINHNVNSDVSYLVSSIRIFVRVVLFGQFTVGL